ncbi:sigma-70 family RNA polymerase sigma factor, partial [Microbacterium sp. SA39]|uniref:sigma-70 family RNA polymerase sigma factor n=1 Tax=Microbacterium sp. SA39 TaxID=1263625 RepID=UPI000698E164
MTVHEENAHHDEPPGDADLILRTRSGDAEAFGELWRRHYPSGLSVARSITSSIDPDDLVQESYTRIYQAIVKGGGPNGSFRAYLFTSIRNTAAAWGRSRRETAIDELDTVADPDSTDQAANEALDRSLTAQAFRSLPSRWQEVLWYTEIEQMKPQEVAPLLGMKSGAVSQLAFRAREGLREAWIQAHLRSAAPGSDCQWTIEHLGAYSRGNLGTRDHKRLELHLDECARCMIVAAEAKDVSTRLALVLLPLVLGVTGAAGYLAALQGGGTPIVALAAMPSSIPGSVFAGEPASGVAAVGAGAGTSAAGSTGGAGVGAGASAAGGVLTGMGALVGVGSAALVVAGVVAAATIVPGLAGADPAASLPSAADVDSSSITSDVGPDASMNLDEPIIIEVPEEAPKQEPTPPAEQIAVPPAEEQHGPAVAPPTAPVEALPELPQIPQLPQVPETPGGTEPGDGGSGAPGDGETEQPGPVLPEGTPTVGQADIDIEGLIPLQARYAVPVGGADGATVRAVISGNADGARQTVLSMPPGGTGAVGSVVLLPSHDQLCGNASVDFFYVAGDQVGTATSRTLRELSPLLYAIAFDLICAVTSDDAEETAVAEPSEISNPPAEETPLPVAESPVAPAPAPVDAAPAPAPVESAPAPAPVEPAPAPMEP